MKGNIDKNVIIHALAGAPNVAQITINNISWKIPHYTPNIPQQTLIRGHIVSRDPTQLSYIERSVGVKPVDKQCSSFFDFKVQGEIDVPIFILLESKR